ncbi:ABC transporter ATP-binding protein [Hathewaya limosa]|uniref:ATP-binding cassette subfamily B protein/ATP-binding cassette subfamily C protein n=1 Tax=Hathewaya limosa TaxID=1536 RepID=A0ABU0JU17_HATLI|nr:ABC transporter ATP-binding protein [Hathewaya limosa]MDQ0479890.1 ATP-binding cassette subfamily B protein/ATP-binding cassette subfamily C protein [Hathewaya limosa]
MKNKSIAQLKKNIKISRYILKLAHGISKTYIPTLVISSIFKAITPFINIIMPKFIIDELMGQKRIKIFIALVLVTIIANFTLNLINSWFDTLIEIKNIEILNGFDMLIGKKIMEMEFQNIEDPEVLDLKERVRLALRTQGIIGRMINAAVSIFTQIISLIGLIAVIASLDLYIVLFIIVIVIITSFIYQKSQKAQYEFHKSLMPLNRGYLYYSNITTDFSMGKDVRLYNICPLIMDKVRSFNKDSVEQFVKLFKIMGRYNGTNEVGLQVQMFGIYAYMTYKVCIGTIGIGSFTMYVASANNFSATVSKFVRSFIELSQMCRYLEDYISLEQIKSNKTGKGKSLKNTEQCTVEFKNVSFKYPRCDEYTLKNVSITIKQGEKLSVVGSNGAGKTTFIKLLTRLYEPTDGEILLNGINIKEYNYDEYMKLLSVVFQDFKLFAFTVKENIVLNNEEENNDRGIENSLKQSGLEKDILKMPEGIDTHIYKIFEENGIEFSGGQSQKLAISRAVYKDAPIVVLDEPTAALDPIAESEIYSRFNELIGNKTAIYISHRLSSCKFCDKIAVFHKGEIIQYGTHEELIKDSDNQYEKMYNAQAQYYV